MPILEPDYLDCYTFFIITILLFFFLAVLGLSCGMRGSSLRHAGSFIGVHGLFVVACRLLSSCGARAPEHAGSVAAACGLSCPAQHVGS